MKSEREFIDFKICFLVLLLGSCGVERLAAQTGTFLDRHLPTDIRVVSYNVYVNSIFPETNAIQAEKFVRLVNALDADILNLQEVRSSAQQVKELFDSIAPLEGGGWYTHKARDNVIASKYPLSMLRTYIDPSSDRPPAVALVNLPDTQYGGADFYIINHHAQPFVAIPGPEKRQKTADSTVQWLRDARTPGGLVDLLPGTPIAVLGDMNSYPEQTAVDSMVAGDIFYENIYGPDSPPDWDGTSFVNARPTINGTGVDDYTYRWDTSRSRLDHITYSDSALDVANKFVLNTVEMSPADLAATGLQPFDVTIDQEGVVFDHLPVVSDFRIFEFANSDFNFSRSVGSDDLAIWQAGYNSSGSSRMEGDADGDGDVDGRDFLFWQRAVDVSDALVASQTQTVPEPSSQMLLITLVTVASCLRKRHRAYSSETAGSQKRADVSG